MLMPTNKTIKNYTIIGTVLLIYLTLIIGLLVWLFKGTAETQKDFMLQSPVIIIIAIVISVLTFTVASAVFAAIGKGKDDKALGMPEGSIRALIALSLIALFFILATQMYSRVSANGVGKLESMSEESLKDLSIKDIITKEKIDSFLNSSADSLKTLHKYSYRYNVSIKVPVNSDAGDMAKNIIASFTALIAAISGFYFGSGASKQSADSKTDTSNTIKITPKNPIPSSVARGSQMTFEFDVSSSGQPITVQVIGDSTQPAVDPNNHLKFTYTPSATAAANIKLKVFLNSNPANLQEYPITITPAVAVPPAD